MAILNNNPLVGASGNQGGYNINNSLRFRSSASAYLSRTLSTPTNNKIFTYSVWVKRGALGGNYALLSPASSGTGYTTFRFESDDTINFQEFTGSAYNYQLDTTQVFRDPSAWYHLVVAVDTTQATAANRIKLYVNGNQITAFGTATYPTQNLNPFFNSAVGHNVGANIYSGSREQYFDGYMTDINFIDGQALTPSSFGETDTTTGVWKPKAYTGTYGTNGFYLKFSDIATTSGSNAGLGKDFSGNSNYWTTNNISVTSGTTYDAMTDSPTNTSATVANYATLNPLDSYSTAISNGNLKFADGSGSAYQAYSTMSNPDIVTYKFYCEVTVDAGYLVGIVPETKSATGATADRTGVLGYYSNGNKYNNTTASAYGATFTANDVIGIAFGNGQVEFFKNNVSQGVAFSSLTGGYKVATWAAGATGVGCSFNFGQRPFTYTPPTGFVALNTFNLPTPTILQGNKYMDAKLYTGTGTGSLTVGGLAFQPDLVWGKSRNDTISHILFDVVRGENKQLSTNTTSAETVRASDAYLFEPDGFTVTTVGNLNNAVNYAAWCWKADNTSGVSNTSGSITSTVSVNATAGFSIVTWTATGSNATIGHGLGVAPKMIITKGRNAVNGWNVYTSTTGNGNYLRLDTTAASTSGSTYWNNTSPTSTVFSTGTWYSNTETYVAYCWAEISGFSKFGSYTGNGSADGPFVYCGFRPTLVLVKSSSAIDDWYLYDNKRDGYNGSDRIIYPNLSNAESSGVTRMDFLSNGIKLRTTTANNNGVTYIYMAFAENPFKNSNAR